MRVLFLVFISIMYIKADTKVDNLEQMILQNKKNIEKNYQMILGNNLDPLFSYDNKTLKEMLVKTNQKNDFLEQQTNNLKVEILLLKKEIEDLKNKIDKEDFFVMYVNRVDVSIKDNPKTNANVIKKLYKDESVKLEYCKNGWCKLYNEKLFIAKYLLREKL